MYASYYPYPYTTLFTRHIGGFSATSSSTIMSSATVATIAFDYGCRGVHMRVRARKNK